MLNNPDILSHLHASAILIVDDDPVSRTFIEMTLRNRGFKNLYSVDSAEKAMEHLICRAPELVILDIFMSGLTGLECCTWIRQQPKFKDLPVLMLTGMTDEKLRGQSFQAGATDFVSKPLHPEELCGRVNVHLLNRLSMKSLQRYKERLELELEGARELQAAILPNETEIREAQQQCQLEFAGHLDSSSEIGGDFWGFKRLLQQQMALWTVDFSGHGVASALNAFRLQAYLKESTPFSDAPGEYLGHLNEKLLRLLLRGHFATMFYGVVDPVVNRLHYACACSPHPLILKKKGAVHQLDGTGLPLGLEPHVYATQQVEFRVGDTLVLYSDALTETPDENGRYITENDIAEVLSANASAPASVLMQRILTYFEKHSAAPLRDDLTLSICKRVE